MHILETQTERYLECTLQDKKKKKKTMATPQPLFSAENQQLSPLSHHNTFLTTAGIFSIINITSISIFLSEACIIRTVSDIEDKDPDCSEPHQNYSQSIIWWWVFKVKLR